METNTDMNADTKANEIRGFKATLSNPKVSQEAKEHAKKQLKELGAGDFDYSEEAPPHEKNTGNVAGGLKAAINNPQVTEEGKQQAQEKLDNLK